MEINGQQVRLGLADAIEDVWTGSGPEFCTAVQNSGPDPIPGTVLGADAEGLLVAAGAGVLRLRRLQRPGGRMLSAAEFLRGFPVKPGAMLPSRPMTALLR